MRRERTRQRWTLGHGSWTESYGAGRVEFVPSIAARTAYRKGDRMAGPAEIVERYFDAWTSKGFETARSLLHDDLAFSGPLETVADADALLRSLQRLAQIVTGVERRGVIASATRSRWSTPSIPSRWSLRPWPSGTRSATARSRRSRRSSTRARSQRCSSSARPESGAEARAAQAGPPSRPRRISGGDHTRGLRGRDQLAGGRGEVERDPRGTRRFRPARGRRPRRA